MVMAACSSAQDLNYRVRNNAKSSERITLLHKVSGYLLPGHLSALVSNTNCCCTVAVLQHAGTPRLLGNLSSIACFKSACTCCPQMGPSGSSKQPC